MKVAITAKIKNGALWEAAEKMGGIKQLAEHLNLPYTTLISYMNMRLYPSFRNPKSPYDWKGIEAKLLALTGLLLDEIFPVELANSEFMDRPLAKTIVHDVPILQLTAVKEQLLLPGDQEEVEQQIDNDALRERLLKAMSDGMTDQQRLVLTMRFGLDGQGERTLDEVAKVLKVGSERVRQIEAKALRNMRHLSRANRYKFFIEKCEHKITVDGYCARCRLLIQSPEPVDDESDTLEAARRARRERESAGIQ